MGSGRGAGGKDARPVRDTSAKKGQFSLDQISLKLKDDVTVLRHMWFGSKKGDDHAQRLESFYGPQAAACELAGPRMSAELRSGLTRALPAQTTPSARGSCGGGSRCSQPAPLASPTAPTSYGWTWAAVQGWVARRRVS